MRLLGGFLSEFRCIFCEEDTDGLTPHVRKLKKEVAL